MTKWQYLEVTHTGAEERNKLGADGWELVTIMVVNNVSYYFFKRPLTDVAKGE